MKIIIFITLLLSCTLLHSVERRKTESQILRNSTDSKDFSIKVRNREHFPYQLTQRDLNSSPDSLFKANPSKAEISLAADCLRQLALGQLEASLDADHNNSLGFDSENFSLMFWGWIKNDKVLFVFHNGKPFYAKIPNQKGNYEYLYRSSKKEILKLYIKGDTSSFEVFPQNYALGDANIQWQSKYLEPIPTNQPMFISSLSFWLTRKLTYYGDEYQQYVEIAKNKGSNPRPTGDAQINALLACKGLLSRVNTTSKDSLIDNSLAKIDPKFRVK